MIKHRSRYHMIYTSTESNVTHHQNCGVNTIRTLTNLVAKHAVGGITFGIDGESGEIVDMKDFGVWDTFQVTFYFKVFVS